MKNSLAHKCMQANLVGTSLLASASRKNPALDQERVRRASSIARFVNGSLSSTASLGFKPGTAW